MKTYIFILIFIAILCVFLGLYFCFKKKRKERARQVTGPRGATAGATSQASQLTNVDPEAASANATQPSAPPAQDCPPSYDSLFPERK